MRAAMLLCVTVVLAVAAQAATDPAPDWHTLSDTQQRALSALEAQWDTLDAQRRQNILTGLETWQSLDQAGRDRAQRRFGRWRDLPDDERTRLRGQFERFQGMDSQQKDRLRALHERFKHTGGATPYEQSSSSWGCIQYYCNRTAEAGLPNLLTDESGTVLFFCRHKPEV